MKKVFEVLVKQFKYFSREHDGLVNKVTHSQIFFCVTKHVSCHNDFEFVCFTEVRSRPDICRLCWVWHLFLWLGLATWSRRVATGAACKWVFKLPIEFQMSNFVKGQTTKTRAKRGEIFCVKSESVHVSSYHHHLRNNLARMVELPGILSPTTSSKSR